MKTKLLLPTFIFFFITSIAFSQDWIKLMNDPTVNFYDVQKEFNKAANEERMDAEKILSDEEDMEENEIPGYLQYKRWEWFTEQRVYPSGDRSMISKSLYDVKQKLFTASSNRLASAGNWTLLGPNTTFPVGSGAGRINCIAIHPTNSNIIFVGAASGGLWKTTDGGSTWSTNTDNFAVLGITDIAIDPVNPNIMYIATGDGEHSDNYSVGVLKSTDGGNTWNITSLSFSIIQNNQMYRLAINPANPNMIYAGSSLGLYLSKDAGATWVKTLNVAGVKNIEFKPQHSNVVYAVSSTGFYRSLNAGLSFTKITSGLPSTSAVNRLAIAVTPADSNYVYVLAGQSSISGFYGLYRSTNGGTSFTLQSNKPNILGWVSNGSDSTKGGQSWYTLTIAASPTNKNEIVTGGVNIWHSSNGGVSWNIM
ncbi:MAG: glycosyl hydrolase, partial [Bacteroidetes bacterium]|nr:glycosyl hydrolase [Bacteroidota bacterium]